jgi:amidophosphoribosyltransferase
MARDAGAKKVYFASCSPPIIHPNVYGIDMPAKKEYVAYGRDNGQICEAIGADLLFYQRLDDLVDACLSAGIHESVNFDCSCFNGVYVTGGITKDYLEKIENIRNDKAKITTSV